MSDSHEITSQHDSVGRSGRDVDSSKVRRPVFQRRDRKRHRVDLEQMVAERRKDEILYAGLEPTRRGYENEMKLGHRMYKLVGYTTYSKVKRKYQMERNQRVLRDLLTVLIIIILLVMLLILYNPFKDTDEVSRMFGWNSQYENPQESVDSEESDPSTSVG